MPLKLFSHQKARMNETEEDGRQNKTGNNIILSYNL